MAFQVTEVQKALKGADYPMNGEQLADLAKSNGADQELVDALRRVREVDGPNTVMQELKGDLGGSSWMVKVPVRDVVTGLSTTALPSGFQRVTRISFPASGPVRLPASVP